MKKDKKILFITPGASSVGGNIFLLNFLCWFKQNSNIGFITLYNYGGDLEGEFAKLSQTYTYKFQDDSASFLGKSFAKMANHLELKRLLIKSTIGRGNIKLIYSNSVINNQMLSMFADLDVPVISHCHELQSVIHMIGINEFIETKNRTTHFVAVSEVVRKNLIDNHQIPADKISLIYEFIPVADLSSAEINARREKVLSELAIPNNAFIVGASGSLNWRKAPELFIQIAAEVRKLKPDAPIYFLWVGGARAGDFALFEVNYDVDKLDLQDRVRFLEHTSNPFDYYAALDVLTLVSREDPYPLVCLEAASLGKPIICFADAGGMPEFVGDECGFVVPYLDIQTFAARILDLYANTELRERFGKNARCKVMQNHDIDVSAPRVLEIIEKYYT